MITDVVTIVTEVQKRITMSPTNAATGRAELRDGKPHLVLERTFSAPIEQVWDALANSVRLEQWIGRYTGDPASGEIDFYMTAEAVDAPAERCQIHECQPWRRAVLEIPGAGEGVRWLLTLDYAQEGEGTRLVFAHELDDAEMAASVGPGWEYYLDRYVAAVEGRDVASAVWDEYYPAQADHYRDAVAAIV